MDYSNTKNNDKVKDMPISNASTSEIVRDSHASLVTDDCTGLHWHNGIGSLPGSNMKFRKNEVGDIEVIMETLKTEPNNHHNETTLLKRRDNQLDSVKTEGDEIYEPSERRYHDRHPTENGRRPREKFVPTNVFDTGGMTCSSTMEKLVTTDMMPSGTDLSANLDSPLNSELDKSDALFARGEGITHQAIDFDWVSYLEEQNAIAAPTSAFIEVLGREPFPSGKIKFSAGDLLESVDPLHQSLICAVSVVEVKGFRMRLHFEGYATRHDFWVNAEDKLLFPCGFCVSTGRELHPPKDNDPTRFDWSKYAKGTGKSLAGKEKFRDDFSKCYERNTEFEIGDKLEAVDRSNPQFICVATVWDIIDDRILIHFDGWNHNFDYWCDDKSNYIYPVGWCTKNGKTLSVPLEFSEDDNFTWVAYLQDTQSRAAPKEAFRRRTSHNFDIGMRLEVVDKRNPILVRVATVVEKNSYQIKVHFDGWDELYDYWIDVDSTDLHPITWCEKTGHPLQPNITEEERKAWQGGCPIPGCRGLGHIKGSKFVGHHSEYGCPYSSKNLDSYPIQDRIMPRRGPKPSSLMSRRMVSVPTEREKVSTVTESEKRKSMHRRASRSSVFAEKDKNGFSAFHATSPASSEEPPEKMSRNDGNGIEGALHSKRSNLHYSISSSTVWSSFPDKHLAQYWEQCAGLLPGVTGVRGSEICKWSSKEVSDFVTGLTGQEKYGKLFLEEEIDGEAFLLLTQNDIFKVLNIKLGPTLKIHGAILFARTSD